MKFGFITCVQLGLSCMEAIYEVGGSLALAITLPDNLAINKSGRVYLDNFCSTHNITLLKSNHVNNIDVIDAIKNAQIDWLFIIGWSQIAGPEVLSAPRLGVLGIHPSLLPVGRGRAAIPWAILKELDKTGVTLFKMDEGVDTGPVADQIEIKLSNNITATSLYEKVNLAHIDLIRKSVTSIINDTLFLTPQDNSKASIWPGRKPEDGEINLNGSVYDAEKLIRAVTKPYPGAYIIINDLKYIIWSAKIIFNVNEQISRDKILKFNDGLLLLVNYEIINL